MKWFKRFFIGLVGLYLIALGIDIFISKSLLKSNLFSGELNVWNDIYDENIDEDLVIYGSSRSYVHINPEILDKELSLNSYNLGFNAFKINFQKYRHNLFLKNHNPKNIIINLDINSLSNLPVYKPEQFLPMLLYNEELYSMIKTSLNSNYKLRYREIFFPLIRYRHYNNDGKNIIKELRFIYFNKKNKQFRIKGFEGINRKWEDENLEEQIVLISEDRKNDLFEMIRELKDKDINIILINSPEYISQIRSQKNRKEVLDLYKSIANKYNIPFVDYTNDSINFKKELFYNSDHLNAKGADVFTRKLAKDIKPYLKY